MSKRSCEYCRYFAENGGFCSLHITDETCEHFLVTPKWTVSSKIRIKMKDEELAELLVYEQVIIKNIEINDSYISHNHGTYMKMWKSALLPTKFFDDKQKAKEATLAELQKEAKDE